MVRKQDPPREAANAPADDDPFAMLEAQHLKEKSEACSKETPETRQFNNDTADIAPSRNRRSRQSSAVSESDSEASEDERWAQEREARRKRALEEIDEEYESRAKQRAVMEKNAEETSRVQEAALQAGFTPLERYILRSGEIAEKYRVSDLKIKEKVGSRDRSGEEAPRCEDDAS